MKRKQILLTIGIAMTAAIIIPAIAEATIYLMKGGKIVASYPDESVEYITFEDPSSPDFPDTYDVDTRSYFLNSNYYGDTQEKDGYNYAVQFYDLPADSKGNLPIDAVVYNLFLNGPEVADKKAPFIPEGTYNLAEPGGGKFTILSDNFSYVRNNKTFYFKKAQLKVSKNGAKWKYEFTGIADNDKTYHTVYDGVPTAYNQSIEWLNSDEHIQGGTIVATWLDKSQGAGPDGNGANINIQIAENGYDQSGYLVKPGNFLTLVGNVDMDERGNIKPGTWTVVEKDTVTTNQLIHGHCINFLGSSYPVYSVLQHWSTAEDVSVGLIKSGTMTVTSSKGVITYRYDFTTDKGKKVTGLYQGQITVRNHPYAESLKLDKDYTLDLTDRIATCRNNTWSKDVTVEVYKFDSKTQYMGDRIGLKLVPANGVLELQPGIYKVNGDSGSTGSIIPGSYTPSNGASQPSVFVKFSSDEPGKVLKASAIKGGQVEVKKNSDGTWTLIYDLLDEQATPKRITGTWTGNFKE